MQKALKASRSSQKASASKPKKAVVAKKMAKKSVNKVAKRSMSASKTASFKINRSFKTHKLDSAPSETVETTAEEMIKFYTEMALYRRVEIVSDTLYKQRLIRGFCHLYDGQEAVLAGMEHNLKRTDSVITAYRDHCHQISRGGSVVGMLAELMGRKDGCSLGKGGSMHMYHKEGNFYGGNGIVGAQVPLGAGLAFAHKYNKDGGLAVAAYGDGAANQGQIFEVANMAALMKLPMIFLCENNNYAMGTSTARHAASTDFYTRGDYVPGLWIDGMDVLAVKEGFRFATEYVRSGKGPIFVEASCYRYHGHSLSDPGLSYRTRDEVANVRASRDPIDNTRNRIFEAGFATPEDMKQIDKEVREQVDMALQAAKDSPQPPVEELYEHIFSGIPPKIVRGVELANSVVPKH